MRWTTSIRENSILDHAPSPVIRWLSISKSTVKEISSTPEKPFKTTMGEVEEGGLEKVSNDSRVGSGRCRREYNATHYYDKRIFCKTKDPALRSVDFFLSRFIFFHSSFLCRTFFSPSVLIWNVLQLPTQPNREGEDWMWSLSIFREHPCFHFVIVGVKRRNQEGSSSFEALPVGLL